MNMIELIDIKKTYRTSSKTSVYALKGISTAIEAGELVALQGKSGSGKSTLLRIMGCIDTFDSGSLKLLGQEVSHVSDSGRAKLRNAHIGIVPQQYGLIYYRSAWENVSLPLMLGRHKANAKSRSIKALESVGIGELANRRTDELSGGEQQRVAIARAIVSEPDIILADEPTGNLDSASAAAIMELLVMLNKTGKTIVIATHDNDIAAACNRIINLSDGTILHG